MGDGDYLATKDQAFYHLPIDQRQQSIADSKNTTSNIYFPLDLATIRLLPSGFSP